MPSRKFRPRKGYEPLGGRSALSFCSWRVCGYLYKSCSQYNDGSGLLDAWQSGFSFAVLYSALSALQRMHSISTEWVALLTSQRSSDIILQSLGLPKLFLSSTYRTLISSLMISNCFYLSCQLLWRPIYWRPFISALRDLYYSTGGCTTA